MTVWPRIKLVERCEWLRREIENFLTFLSFCFLDAFGRPVTGRKSRRGDGNTSDHGTGDEATLACLERKSDKRRKRGKAVYNAHGARGVAAKLARQMFPLRCTWNSFSQVSAEILESSLYEATQRVVGFLCLEASNLSFIEQWWGRGLGAPPPLALKHFDVVLFNVSKAFSSLQVSSYTDTPKFPFNAVNVTPLPSITWTSG